MRKIATILMACFLLMDVMVGRAQVPTTQGKEFWVSFMRNGFRDCNGGSPQYDNLTLIVSAKRGCTGTVMNPNTGWSQSFAVLVGSTTTLTIPANEGYNTQDDFVADKGLKVITSDTVSLYIANEVENSYDASNVLPIPTLGSSYMIQGFEPGQPTSMCSAYVRTSFLVVADEDNTVVDITPTVRTGGGHEPGQTYTISLNSGQTYHVLAQNNYASGDLSGTTVVARNDKKIAVFNGNALAAIPVTMSNGYDHVFDQAMPTDYWGKKFVVTSTMTTQAVSIRNDYIKITALEDETVIMKNGEPFMDLNSGQSDVFEMDCETEPSCFLESDKPIAVYLYQRSHPSDYQKDGDPSMVWISPVEQTVFEVTFTTFQVQEVRTHYVNVVCYTDYLPTMKLDGNTVSLQFRRVEGNPMFSYARIALNHGVHTLENSRGFVAHVYGIGQAEGYAYSVGSSAKLLTKQMYINDELSTTLPDGYHTCQAEDIQFRTEVNYEFTHIDWTFGDGNTDSGPEVSHSYSGASDYNVSSVVYRIVEGIERPFDTLTAVIHVHPVQQGTPIHESTCGNTYTFNGQDYPVPYDGDIVMTSQYGCDSIVHLKVDEGELSLYPVEVQACEGYMWYDTLRTESGRYEHWVYDYNEDGCDSLYVLNLYVGHPSTTTVMSVENCGIYYWNGLICDTTGEYSYTFITESGCDSIVILPFTHVDVDPIYENMTACEPTQWYEHQMSESGDYEHLSHESSGCDTLHVMHFTLDDKIQEEYTMIECDEYEWYGTPYTQSGTYHHTVPGTNGCDSLLTLHLTLHKTPVFEKIDGLSNIAVASSYWPGTYNYYVDGTGVDPDSIHWELVDNPGWNLIANGASCQITATSMGVVRLRVWTTGLDKCNKEAMMDICCGGFDVEETSQNIRLYPNPTEGLVTIEADAIKSVKVYDYMGQFIRLFEGDWLPSMNIDLSNYNSSLYFIEVETLTGNKVLRVSVF